LPGPVIGGEFDLAEIIRIPPASLERLGEGAGAVK
jgi:hypothetical protein